MSVLVSTRPSPLAAQAFLSASQVAELFGVTAHTVRLWARAGQIPRPLRIGQRALRWRREDLDHHLAALAQEGHADAS